MHDGQFQATADAGALSARIVDRLTPGHVAALTFAVLTACTAAALLAATGGHLFYSLDDPYIHLALAERIAAGHYGINPDEVTSPASSILWPFLFVPGAGSPLHPFLPLIVNLLCGLATVLICARIAEALPLPGSDPGTHVKKLAIAACLVIATNTVGLAFTGMEHNLQVVLAVAAAAGLLEVFRGRPMPAWALVAALVGPAVRYEMFAVTIGVAITLFGLRQRWRAVGLVAAAAVIPVAFSLFLLANGNSPLPNSVLTKLHLTGATAGGTWPFAHLLPPNWADNLPQKATMWLILGALLLWARQHQGIQRWVLAAAAAAALLHLLLGRFGWFSRYEIYALAFCGLIALWQMAKVSPRYVVYAAMLPAALYVGPLLNTPAASRNIQQQQYQMARFVQAQYRKPFAVNDLGLVSYRLDRSIYVLDLWGLASNEAARRRNKSPDWLDDITRRHGAGLAMIYDEWFPAVPRSWTKVGVLTIPAPVITPASDRVSFYATAVGNADEIARELTAFKPSLPAGVTLQINAPSQPR